MEAGSVTQGSLEAPSNESPRRSKMETWFSSRMHVCIKMVEARSLRGYDATTQSSDPFAKLRLSAPGESTPAHEHRTRTIYRNLNPMFAESLICPLSSLKPDYIFELKMYDADWLRNEVMGHIKSTLGDLLRPLESGGSPNLVWMNLTRKHGSLWRKPEGEVLLEVSVLPGEQANKALSAQRQFRLQEAASRYQDCQLEVMLRGLCFRSAMTASAIAGFAKNLLVEVRFGQSSIVRRVNGKIAEDENDDRDEGLFDLEFDEVIRLPLGPAFQASQAQIASAIQRAGITTDKTDVRIILHNDGNLISKTQVPLCCFPWAGDSSKPSQGGSPDSPRQAGKGNLGSRASSMSSALKFADTGSTIPKQEGEPDDTPTSFVRTMEPLARRSPFAASTIEFCAALVKKAAPLSTASSSEPKAECQVLDMLEDQEDMRDAPPLEDIPPPLDFPCLDMEFAFGPCRLYQMLIKSASKINGKIAAIEGLSNMQAGPWELVETDKGKVRQRRLTYRKPVSVPVPFAPKHADMTVIQTINRKEVSGWVLTIENYTSAPLGDTFKVVIQTLGLRGKTSGSSMLKVSMQVEFLKNPGMLKNVIVSQAQKEAQEHWALVKKFIREAFEEEETGQTEAPKAPQSQEAPPPVEPVAAPVVEARKLTVLQLFPWQTVLPVLGLLLLALLVLSVREHAHAVRGLAESIAQLAAAQQA